MNADSIKVLIPARSGSKRLPNKNLATFGSRSLLENAVSIGLSAFGDGSVFVSTDSSDYAELARQAGAEVPSLRPSEFAEDGSLDIDWLSHALTTWEVKSEFVSILRPTSPFLTPASMKAALGLLIANPDFHSIRAIRRVSEHPGKMWRKNGNAIIPLLPQILSTTPSHSRPTQSLEPVFVQCGAFEIVRTETVVAQNSISGDRILGYELTSEEGLDINSPLDYEHALHVLASRKGI